MKRIAKCGAWRGFAMLAFVSLAIVLARPVCEAFGVAQAMPGIAASAVAEHAHGDAAHPSQGRDSCCDVARGIALMSVASAASDGQAGGAVPVAPTGTAFLPVPPGYRAAVRVAEQRPRPLPYHARTARILA